MRGELAHDIFGPRDVGMPVRLCQALADEDPIQEAQGEPIDLSHELRTILAIITLISGNLDLFYERLDEEKRRSMIRDIRTHTRKLNTLIDDVLNPSDDRGIVLVRGS
jgi:light-regulated signal transduction histidine kinase (bacteriophytochrome)